MKTQEPKQENDYTALLKPVGTKQTAVEYLLSVAVGENVFDDLEIEKAKRMFEQQIIQAGNTCAFKQHLHSDRINKMSAEELEQYNLEPFYTFGEEHYNETFNK
jgi:hypothetical protein